MKKPINGFACALWGLAAIYPATSATRVSAIA
jgi:hypothetical protein